VAEILDEENWKKQEPEPDLPATQGLSYSFNDTTREATVINLQQSVPNTDIVIPSTVSHQGVEYTVTAIGERAFFNRQRKLTSVVIPNTVKSIGHSAFGFNQLTHVTIPDSVTSMGGNVFSNNQLTSVNLSNSLTEMGAGVFSNNQITHFEIPSSLTTIPAQSFLNKPLATIKVSGSLTRVGIQAFQGSPLQYIGTVT